jgi:hypothetical protein
LFPSLLFIHRNSIYAQRTVERLFVTPERVTVLPDPDTFSTEPMMGVAHANVKGKPEGAMSSYTTAVIYAEQSKARRDELLAKYASTNATTSTK